MISVVNASTFSDNFDDNLIDSTIWLFGNSTGGGDPIIVNETDSRLVISGNYSQYGNRLQEAYMETIVEIGAGDEGRFEISYISLNVPTVNNIWAVGISDTYTGVNSWGSTPPTWCGVVYMFTNNELKLSHGYPSASLLSNEGAMDSGEHEILVIVSRQATTTTYKMYHDGVLVATDSQASGCSNPYLHVSITGASSSSTTFASMAFDDFVMLGGISTGALEEGCTTGADCDCGVCTAGYCDYIPIGSYCTLDECCLSADCTNNKCSRADFIDLIDRSKDQLFGDDQETSNFISMFFMIGIPLAIIFAGRNLIALIGGGVIYFALALFFVLAGWLSPFIFVMSFVTMLILMIIAFAVGGMGGE